ncbi:MAG: hypothetical protein ACE5KF_11645 [Kiloniellaceae bacterium]
MTTELVAWLIVILGFGLPLLQVAASPKSGPWRPPPGSRCPLGPRVGWLVMVLFLGPIGWLLYLRARARAKGSRGPRGAG